ncbi:UDP-3-O-[3-hydroxymyristoyl] glucosamine N-acyltransferase [Methylacidimicrobium cyclopophantes]|uniref:UDP-3-O-acylglucosamine N-acyltransferase n=1 Tax=Methylacidimicrobium cyclopophantes TaxID=1041766 RepID=A0A5E6M695_9BACT|nr:UDP-3-O-(3-hydroxymyristoyl)glucosamine N-acyltransferase [Methylacidimicrobium cyclopophantes]VVM04438.1 UDP-3-O-[3-hydroxymyristoyl] glucosamine N-acyltransferase [Methylacidimicrobium cyclopophantes]
MASFLLGELADLVNGEVDGERKILIRGVAGLEAAEKGEISFYANPRYEKAARQTKASALLVSRDFSGDFPCALVRVDSPSLAFSQVVALFAPEPIAYPPGVHPSAVVSTKAVVGEGAHIGPLAVVEAGVRIGAGTIVGAGCFIGTETVLGDGCLLYPRVIVRERCTIGNRVILHSGAVIGSDGFGYEFAAGRHRKIPQTGTVQIDDDVEIGANATIDRGRFGKTWIQEGCKIDNLVQIAHNVVLGPHCLIVAQTGISGSTILGSRVTLAGQVGLAGHLRIGDGAVVTAQSGITKDVPPGTILSGRHGRPATQTLRLEALYLRLPDLWRRLRRLEKRIGLESDSAETPSHPDSP